MRDVFGEHGPAMVAAEDERPVEAFATQRGDHALADRVGSGCPDRVQHDVQVTTSLLPAGVSGSPPLIERLIASLTDNAIRQNHRGGRVDIRTGMDGEVPTVRVTNTGSPVAEEGLDRLFEPF